jgi:hypothetical protein
MRTVLVFIVAITVVLARPAMAQSVTDQDPGSRSLLAPRPDQVPPPMPVGPMPMGLGPTGPASNPQPDVARDLPPPSTPDQGTITAVPLPPPGMAPSDMQPQRVAPAVPPGNVSGPATAAVPATGTPISLAPPRLSPPPLAPNSLALSPLPPRPATPLSASPTPSELISNKLPTPALSAEASPVDFLRAARGALASGRNGEARSALEMAQTRLLGRVVEAGKEQEPSRDAAVRQISEAIDALVANDRMACLRYIEFASQTLGNPLD